MRAVVAGGGIGGLACAIALAGAGHEVTVLERRDSFAELGAGIQIAPNGFRALAALGVADDVLDRAVLVEQLAVRDGATGERLIGLDTDDEYRRHFGFPYAVVQRDDLYQPLVAACADADRIALAVSTGVFGYRNTDDGVVVHTDRGDLAADVLIGADGLRSNVRRQLVGDGAPRISGHTIYRAVLDMDAAPQQWRRSLVTLWAGDDWHAVHYPIASGRLLNVAVTHVDHATTEVIGAPVSDDVALAVLSGAHPEVVEIARRCAGWRSWVLCDRPPVRRWVDGAVALAGDAAHPMLQYAAQGASMALEDAIVLGEVFAGVTGTDVSDTTAALARYNAERFARTGVVQSVSVEMGRQVFHAEQRPVAERNAWLAGFDRARVLDDLQWLHGGSLGARLVGAGR